MAVEPHSGGVLGERNARHFGVPEVSYSSYDYPGTAGEALDRLAAGYRLWIDGVRASQRQAVT